MNEAVIRELDELYQRDGKLLPEAVVERAKDPESALHGHLEWDNEAAGHAYRLMQARRLIRKAQYQSQGTREIVLHPKYVRDPSHSSDDSYVETASFRGGPRQAEVMARELTRAGDALERARRIAVAIGAPSDRIERLGKEVRDVEAALTQTEAAE